jgi:parallel beta-helix repeat protein
MPKKISKAVIFIGALFLLLFVSATWVFHTTARASSAGSFDNDIKEEMKIETHGALYQGRGGIGRRERIRRENQDRAGGLPPEILALQSNEKVQIPTIDDAVKIALTAAEEAALPLIDTKFHNNGKTIMVPDDHKSIQAAIDAASSGDVVLVKPGTYYEHLVIKDGVKVVSDSADEGDELVPVEGAMLKLPRRTLRTIIDGSKSEKSHYGMFDFNPGVGRKTIIDGFTIQNLPDQNHYIPDHAHGLNLRGASPVITNCLIRNNGSTGIGSHVVYHDQDSPMPDRDFRWNNVKHRASAVIFHNIIYGNFGLGISCDHFSDPFILGNEVFNNSDAELNASPSPGMGNRHGSAATIIGNINHDNPGGGILCQEGTTQGMYHIDRPTHPIIMKNVVYDSGSIRPGIACNKSGSETMPVKIIGNYVFNSGVAGISLQIGSVGIIEDNMVVRSNNPGISVHDSTALRLNRNKVTGTKQSPGFAIVNGANIHEMIGNASDSNRGPRFVLGSGVTVIETDATNL